MNTEAQQSFIRKLKNFGPTHSARIEIRDARGAPMGSLEPVDREILARSAVIDLLSEWRSTANRWFLTQFVITPQTTRAWLANQLLNDDRRLLWLVLDQTGRYVGTLGVRDVSCEVAEIDHVLRGERGVGRDLMRNAHRALIGWLLRTLEVRKLSLRVFADNDRAIALYRAVGFRIIETHTLRKVICEQGIKFEPDPLSGLERSERRLHTMVLANVPT